MHLITPVSFLLIGLTVLLASCIVPFVGAPETIAVAFRVSGLRSIFSTQSRFTMPVATSKRTPVYFFSHGGPNVMFDYDHPAYGKLAALGQEITTRVKPAAVVVFSAHWQAGRSHVEVNTAEFQPLIYDYYGFPPEYYKVQFPNVGSSAIAEKVIGLLGKAGIEAKGVNRGLDHGVFASFRCAFDPEQNPLNVPIVQVSLFQTEDPKQHIQLGRALESLRDENVLIIVSGMAVHNLRDLRYLRFMSDGVQALPYTVSFDQALKEAVEKAPGTERDEAMIKLMKRPDTRQAHPTVEHLLPIHIGVGAAGQDPGRQVWTYPEGSMSWAQFKFEATA